ncbi:MAG TPA: hypothetical protein VGM81_25685 [Burkholderiaceae bacterium]|jgi:hypothetical protein
MLTRKFGDGLVLLAAIALSACGGGGGGDGGTSAAAGTTAPPVTVPTPPVTDPPASAPSTDLSIYALQTQSVDPSYASTQDAGADEIQNYNFLNKVRLAAGAGALNQSAQLDAAGIAHANYNVLNTAMRPYLLETPGNAGFTGAGYADRQAAAGYAGMATSDGTAITNAPYLCAYLQLNTLYRMAELMDPSRAIGIGLQKDPGDADSACVLELGYASAPQYGPSGALVTYPYPNQTGVAALYVLALDPPRPLPDAADILGQPILASMGSLAVMTGDGSGKGSVDTFTLKDASGNPVPAYIVGSSALTIASTDRVDDAGVSRLRPYQAVLVPKKPLDYNAVYTVTFSGKFNGVLHAKTWSFTTTGCIFPVQGASCWN